MIPQENQLYVNFRLKPFRKIYKNRLILPAGFKQNSLNRGITAQKLLRQPTATAFTFFQKRCIIGNM
ncbi:MAG: hypothetical protein ACI4WS_10270, partial [Oscillospiraceae bacterium]